jgi:hypothetical protein
MGDGTGETGWKGKIKPGVHRWVRARKHSALVAASPRAPDVDAAASGSKRCEKSCMLQKCAVLAAESAASDLRLGMMNFHQ